MIERCEYLPQDLPQNVVTARIEALYNTYRDSVGADIYTQTVGGRVTAVFGGTDGSFSLMCFDGADAAELESCFSFLKATVFCFADTAENLNCKKKQVSELFELTSEVKTVDTNGHGKISDVYDVLKNGEDGDIALPPFEFWYTDLCLRFNHGAAEYALTQNAAAVAGFVTEKAALITGIAVDKSARGNGEGSKVLKTLISNIKKKHPCSRVFAATENAAEFYIKNGFSHKGRVAVCEY